MRHGGHLARAARALRQARLRAQARPALGAERHLAAPVCGRTRLGAASRVTGLDYRAPLPAGGGPGKKKRPGGEALSRSRGGLSTKMHAAVDEYGRPRALLLGGGQQADGTRAAEVLAAVPKPRYVLADKGYDTNGVVEQGEQLGTEVVIPSKKTDSRAAFSTGCATSNATGWSAFSGA
ncbi:MAG: IS4/IS5 family transposase [Hymenobacter sp.]|nr:MAG: IS4/IS5 family transposase [Hymenobacter sp.]